MDLTFGLFKERHVYCIYFVVYRSKTNIAHGTDFTHCGMWFHQTDPYKTVRNITM